MSSKYTLTLLTLLATQDIQQNIHYISVIAAIFEIVGISFSYRAFIRVIIMMRGTCSRQNIVIFLILCCLLTIRARFGVSGEKTGRILEHLQIRICKIHGYNFKLELMPLPRIVDGGRNQYWSNFWGQQTSNQTSNLTNNRQVHNCDHLEPGLVAGAWGQLLFAG